MDRVENNWSLSRSLSNNDDDNSKIGLDDNQYDNYDIHEEKEESQVIPEILKTIMSKSMKGNIIQQLFNLRTDSHDKSYNMDDDFNRCSDKHTNVSGEKRILKINVNNKAKFRYKNRHLVYNEDVRINSYYKIDQDAKSKNMQGKWVQLLGGKWMKKMERLAWRCKLIQTGVEIHTFFIDATTVSETMPVPVQNCVPIETNQKWIDDLHVMINTIQTKMKTICVKG